MRLSSSLKLRETPELWRRRDALGMSARDAVPACWRIAALIERSRVAGDRPDYCNPIIAGSFALAVAVVPFAGFTVLILHHFYVVGGFFYDSGLLAFLLSEQSLSLRTPHIFGGESFFATHVTPVFVVLALIRRLLPVTDPQFFAGFTGLCHALPGLGVFWLLHSGFCLRRPLGMAIAAAVALAFSFNGLALAIARYPHFEILIVGTSILFFVALIRRQVVVAGVCFAICLATREDAGFHLFAVLFLLLLLNRRHGVSWQAQRPEIAFALIALLYSITVLGLETTVITGQLSFARIYLGDPPFGTLNFVVVIERLLGWFLYRTYIVLPAIIAVLWALRARNPYIVLGYIAFLPWGLLHLTAQSDIAGTLSGYYAYPFMIASFWPLAGAVLGWRFEDARKSTALAVLAFSAMIACSSAALSCQYNPGHLELPSSLLSPPSLARQEMTDRAIELLVRLKPELGVVRVDGSVLALAADSYAYSETVLGARTGRPDTVIYFAHGYEAAAARTIASAAGLDRHYLAPGTSIRLATDHRLDPSSPLTAIFIPTPPRPIASY
jgi:hypothetical protein